MYKVFCKVCHDTQLHPVLKGLCGGRFKQLYGTEEKSCEALFACHWPWGPSALVAAGGYLGLIRTLAPHRCWSGRRQTLLAAGTIFFPTKSALRTWFGALYQLTRSKGGVS